MADHDPSTRGTGTGSSHGSSGVASPTPGSTKGSSKGSSQRTPGQALAGEYLCVFWLGGKPYALDVAYVAEVIAVQQLSPVPLTPPTVLGMHNLRGTALAIADLAEILGLPYPHRGGEAATMVLVLRLSGRLVGARIERVHAVYEFEKERIKPTGSQAEHPAVQGLVELDPQRGFIATLLDGEEIGRRVDTLRFKETAAAAAVEVE